MSDTKKATTTARKRHRCSFCKFPIEKGEEYHSQRVGPMDHPDNEGFYTIKGHLACLAMWPKVADNFDWYIPEQGSDFIEAVTNAGLAVCCQCCEGSGWVHETEGTPMPKTGWGRRSEWQETECPSCDGHGYRWAKPTPVTVRGGVGSGLEADA